MGEVISFPSRSVYEPKIAVFESEGPRPRNRQEYLTKVKSLLPEMYYKRMLLAVMDEQYYRAERQEAIKTLVDCYYGFEN